MDISLPVYAQCLLVTVLYCVVALPFFLFSLLLNCFSRARMQEAVRFFILWYGKTIIRIGCFPYLRIRYRNLSGEPTDGGIYIFNHRSSSDPFLVAATTLRSPVPEDISTSPLFRMRRQKSGLRNSSPATSP